MADALYAGAEPGGPTHPTLAPGAGQEEAHVKWQRKILRILGRLPELAFPEYYAIIWCLSAGTPATNIGNDIMSQHRSLKGSSKITAKRNVLKRFERIDLLSERGQWREGDRGLGLRKTKPAE